MTVDDYEMKAPPRATGMLGQEGNDNCGHRKRGDEVDRWKELPNLRDGRRENWMTDRAKGSLGTAK